MPYRNIKYVLRDIVTALQADLMPGAGLELDPLFVAPPLHETVGESYTATTVERFEGSVEGAIDIFIDSGGKACILINRVRSQGGRELDQQERAMRKVDPIAVVCVVSIAGLKDLKPAAEHLDDLEEAVELALVDRRIPTAYGVYNLTWQAATALPGTSNWGARLVIFDVKRNRKRA